MVTRALRRLDAALIAAGERGLADLDPGGSSKQIRDELEAMGLEGTADLVDWFTTHDGGWLALPKLEWLSFERAIDHRIELSRELLVPYRASWFPFMVVSTETTVVDTATGEVLRYDLETGDDEATFSAPSLAAWIDEATAKITGDLDGSRRSGVSVSKTWSGERSVSSVDELKDEAQRAMRALSGFARKAADWIDDKEAAISGNRAAQSDTPPATDDQPGARGPEEKLAPAANARETIQAKHGKWAPLRGELADCVALADGRIAAVATYENRWFDVHIIDPNRLNSYILGEFREPYQHRGLHASPTSAQLMVNGVWFYDLDTGEGAMVDLIASEGPKYRSPSAQATWSLDGSYVQIATTLTRDAVMKDGRSGTRQTNRTVLFSVEERTGRDLEAGTKLVGNHLVWVSPDSDSGSVRIMDPDGTLAHELTVTELPRNHGFEGAASADGSILVLSSKSSQGFLTVDVAGGEKHEFRWPACRSIAADGSMVYAIEHGDYTTAQGVMVRTRDGSVEEFGLPQPEDAKFDWSTDGTRFVHHGVTPDRVLAVELIDWNSGTSSTVPMSSNVHVDVAVAVWLGDSTVVFWDNRPNGEATFFASQIVDGQLGPVRDLGVPGTSAAASPPVPSADGGQIAWTTNRGVAWCSPTGGPLHMMPAPSSSTWRKTLVTSKNHVVACYANAIHSAPMT